MGAVDSSQDAPPARDYAIVFGAAVLPDGRASPTLLHRIEGALAWARSHPNAMLVATGARGRFGPAEAEVIADLLRARGVSGDRILIEPCGRDTLESVRLCDGLLRARGDCARVICCTSTFHQPRCAMLLRMLGYRVALPAIPSSWGHLSTLRYAKLVAKESASPPVAAPGARPIPIDSRNPQVTRNL
jgi:uncharacterized SAM-binding protein YcdF (DUF218 family)